MRERLYLIADLMQASAQAGNAGARAQRLVLAGVQLVAEGDEAYEATFGSRMRARRRRDRR